MATTVATPAEDTVTDTVPVRRVRKKLILIAAAALAVLLIAGAAGSYFFLIKAKPAADLEAADEPDAEPLPDERPEPKRRADGKRSPPVFLPLDVFTVNLADRDAERYAQVGITLELLDTGVGDQLKAYMPAIRNDILMVLAHKKASELQERAGKVALAREIKRAALKPLGMDSHDLRDADDEESPVRAVHFSSFIIQ
jgi:flagellar protein FliL